MFENRYAGTSKQQRLQRAVVRRAFAVCTYDWARLSDYLGAHRLILEWKQQVCFDGDCGWGGVSFPGSPERAPLVQMRMRAARNRDGGAQTLVHELGHQVGYAFFPTPEAQEPLIELYCDHDRTHTWAAEDYRHRIMEAFADGFMEAFSPFNGFGIYSHPTNEREVTRIRELLGDA